MRFTEAMRGLAVGLLVALAVACAPTVPLTEPAPRPQDAPDGPSVAAGAGLARVDPAVTATPSEATAATTTPERETPTATPTSAEARPVTVVLGGDVHGEGAIASVLAEGGNPLAGIVPLLEGADLAAVNLETAVALEGTQADKSFTFLADPRLLSALAETGVHAVSLANNHALDYGVDALLETRVRARDAGLLVVGAGEDVMQAYAPEITDIDGRTVALVGLSRVLPVVSWKAGERHPGIASAYEEDRAVEAVRAAAALADHVIVLIHWGTELAVCPDEHQRRLARLLVEAGADVIAGHHPHVLQGIAEHDGTVVAYSLGNLLFSARSPETRRSGLLRVTLTTHGPTDAALTPVLLGPTGEPAPATAAEADIITAMVEARSPGGDAGCTF